MSADNYIIVLKTPAPGYTFEYRVAHVCGRYWEEQVGQPKDGYWSNKLQRMVDVTQHWGSLQEVIEAEFKECVVYTSEGAALIMAHALMKEQFIVEYGVSIEEYPWQFGGGHEVAVGEALIQKNKLRRLRVQLHREASNEAGPCLEASGSHWTGGNFDWCGREGCVGEVCLQWQRTDEIYREKCREENINP